MFQVIEYGLAVSSAPRFAPSNRNCTPATETLSLADADTVTLEPDTVTPPAGAVTDTLGGVVSGVLSGLISAMNQLYRSVVGAVSFSVTLVPAAAVGVSVRCAQ